MNNEPLIRNTGLCMSYNVPRHTHFLGHHIDIHVCQFFALHQFVSLCQANSFQKDFLSDVCLNFDVFYLRQGLAQ